MTTPDGNGGSREDDAAQAAAPASPAAAAKAAPAANAAPAATWTAAAGQGDPGAAQPWPFVPSDGHAWPPATDGDKDYATAIDAAKIEVRKKRVDEEIARAAAYRAADIAVMEEYSKAVLDADKASIDRTHSAAELVQKAAAAIATIYATVLGVSFSVSARPLPGRGMYAAIMLGLAIALSTAFLAYLRDADDEASQPAGSRPLSGDAKTRLLVSFGRWTRAAALQRAPLLRASVIALGAALVFLPAAFITLSPTPTATVAAAWPQPSAAGVATDPVELRSILYTAQVQDYTASQAKPATVDDRLWWVWPVLFAAALVLIAAEALRARTWRRPKPGDSQTPAHQADPPDLPPLPMAPAD